MVRLVWKQHGDGWLACALADSPAVWRAITKKEEEATVLLGCRAAIVPRMPRSQNSTPQIRVWRVQRLGNCMHWHATGCLVRRILAFPRLVALNLLWRNACLGF